MSEIILQCTFGMRDDVLVYEDDTVTVNGISKETAKVTHKDGVVSVALDHGRPTLQQINPYPEIGTVFVSRQGVGWKAILPDGRIPGVKSLAVYENPEAEALLFNTGPFAKDSDTGLWYVDCPTGKEPRSSSVHFSLMIGIKPYSAFTLWEGIDSMEFSVGGIL